MGNYGRGWGDGYGGQSREAIERHDDEEALREGDWDWLEKSPRQARLRQQQGLQQGTYARESSDE